MQHGVEVLLKVDASLKQSVQTNTRLELCQLQGAFFALGWRQQSGHRNDFHALRQSLA
jgi:hypothetical protein